MFPGFLSSAAEPNNATFVARVLGVSTKVCNLR